MATGSTVSRDMPAPRPFRLVYRAFDRVAFDPRKSEQVFAERGFDLGYVSRMFPGQVLEREDMRGYAETRYQAIGEVLGDVFVVVYTRFGRSCRLITAWEAEPHEKRFWYVATR